MARLRGKLTLAELFNRDLKDRPASEGKAAGRSVDVTWRAVNSRFSLIA